MPSSMVTPDDKHHEHNHMMLSFDIVHCLDILVILAYFLMLKVQGFQSLKSNPFDLKSYSMHSRKLFLTQGIQTTHPSTQNILNGSK